MAGAYAVVILALLLGGFVGTSSAQGEKKTLKVTAILSKPFLIMMPHDSRFPPRVGNERFQGYIKDLLEAVSTVMRVNYTIQLVRDGRYGSPMGRDINTWNGMIGELQRGEADIAAADTTMTLTRERVVDFTTPYMTHGTTIVMNKKDLTSEDVEQDPGIFFLRPFAYSVWVCLIVAFIVISVLFYLVTRFHPCEQQNGGPSAEGSGNLGILGSLWFVYGGLTLQGHTRRPRSSAAFVLSAFWWSFSIIFLATYVMGMVSTQARSMFSVTGLKIRSLADIMKQGDIDIGCFGGGATAMFFRYSTNSLYRATWQKMSMTDGPSVFVRSTNEGLERVTKGKYAFVTESPILDYHIGKRCDLVKVGGLLNSKSLAFAVPQGSPLREEISKAFLKLNEEGRLAMLKAKWWRINKECKDESAVSHDMFHPSESPQFRPKDTIDLSTARCHFVFLIIGICVSLVVLAVEVLVFKAKGGRASTGSTKG